MQADRSGERSFSLINRRKFIASAAASLASSAALAQRAGGRSPAAPNIGPVIDVHCHMLPDFLVSAGLSRDDGGSGFPSWSEDEALAFMDGAGIAASIVSAPYPVGDKGIAPKLLRRVNELGAGLKTRRPGRFGFLATLPLPNVAASLSELAFAFDQLGADGVVMLSNHEGAYPGDPQFDPIMAELDRRGTVLLIHPVSPKCPCGSRPHFDLSPAVLDYMFESTRVVANLIASRAFDRYPRIKIIIPHAGAAVPAIADRLAQAGPLLTPGAKFNREDVYRALSSFYFDLAGTPLPRQLPALRSMAGDGRLLYGSDWPFTPAPAVKVGRIALDVAAGADPDYWREIFSQNALALFPDLAKAIVRS